MVNYEERKRETEQDETEDTTTIHDESRCAMAVKVERIYTEIGNIKIDQRVANEKLEMFTTYIRENLERQDKSIEKISDLAQGLSENNALLKQDMEHRFRVFEVEQASREKDKEIKKLTASQQVELWWADPIGKVIITVGTALGLCLVGYLALKLGVDMPMIE